MKNDKYIPALSFDFLTRYYDRVIKKVMPDGFRNILVQQVNPCPNENILDFGTGTAEIAILLNKKTSTANITGIDIDPKVLKIAQRKIMKEDLDIRLLEYDGKNLPLENDYFDKVVSCLVFHHLSPQQKHNALAEIFSVLKTGGKIYVADWGLERNKIKAKLLSLYKPFGFLKHIVEHGKGLFPQYMSDAGFKNVIEAAYLGTKTGTLCYYEAEK